MLLIDIEKKEMKLKKILLKNVLRYVMKSFGEM
jgi:hypothetical protein